MNKKEKLKFHKISFLTNLLIIELDDLQPTAEIGATLHQKSKEFSDALEPFLEVVYDSKQISSGTYLSDMTNKIDTVVRKGFEQILD
jgi:hypothetical protein